MLLKVRNCPLRTGLLKLEALTLQLRGGCVLVGDPAYYGCFGFRNVPDLALKGVPQEYLFALPFGESKPKGTAKFHEGFDATN